MKKNGKNILFFLLLILSLGFLVVSPRPVYSQTCSNPDACNRLIEEYQQEIAKLQGQATTLKNQIAQFDAQIRLTTLKISQTEEQIRMLGGRISQLGDSLTALTEAFNSRAVETYKISRFENNLAYLLTAYNIGDAVSRFHYLQKIQEEDQNLLIRLEEAQTTYEGEKADQEELQEQLERQQASLNAQKAAKSSLLTITRNDEVRYQNLLAQANAQLARFKSFVDARGGASILENQTKCNEGWAGCYYSQRDSQWGNLELGNSGYLMKDSGCFATSVAMLASHVGKDIKPNNIAQSPDAITPGGDVIHNFSVNGIDVHIDAVAGNSTLDSSLSSGPVMAELNNGAHFIVILRKDGGTYYMNDPFLKDGYNKPLSAGGYTDANITGLRLVSFN